MRVRAVALAAAAVLLAACGDPPPPRLAFERVPAASGFAFRHEVPGGRLVNLPQTAMGGFAVVDVDGDGLLDLYFVNGGTHPRLGGGVAPEHPARNRLLRNLGGLRFADVTEGSGADDAGFGMGVCVGDIDGDGAPDLFVANYGGSALLRNRGDGTFEDVTERAGIAPGTHTGAAFLDYDRDGFLDLFVGQYVDIDVPAAGAMLHGMEPGDIPPPAAYAGQPALLYRNRGDGTFEDVTRRAGLAREGKAMGVVATDLDGDGWIDVFVANDALANFAWRNRGDGTFEDAAPLLGLAYGLDASERGAMGVNAADVDGDGHLDYLVPDTLGGCVYAAQKTWYSERASDWGLVGFVRPFTGWTDVAFDADADGDVDVYKVHGDVRSLDPQTSFLLRASRPPGARAPEFERAEGAGADLPGCGRGAVAADLDDDGRLDLVVLRLEADAVLLHNVTEHAGHWISLRLVGRGGNRLAIGARVTARIGTRPFVAEVSGSTGYLCAGDLRVYAGLGGETRLAAVHVRWPDGREQDFGDLEAGRRHELVESAD